MKSYMKSDKILTRYKQYLRLEKSLSNNTVDAYLNDLSKLINFLKEENIDMLLCDIKKELENVRE